MSTPAAMALAVRRAAKDWGLGTVNLNEALDTSETGVDVVDYPETLGAGMYLECDLEVLEVTRVAPTLTVRRAQLGTTAATHTTGTVMVIQPRYTNLSIVRALNHALHKLSGKYPREVYLTDTTLATASETERFAMPAEPAGEGEYIDILRVQMETETSGLYRPAFNWRQEGRFPPALKLWGYEPTGRDLRLLVTQAYYPMAYTDAARATGLTDDLEDYLVDYAAGYLLEHDELYAADWVKQDVAVASDLRGRMQVIGRNMQAAADEYLLRIRPSTRQIELGDARNYRR